MTSLDGLCVALRPPLLLDMAKGINGMAESYLRVMRKSDSCHPRPFPPTSRGEEIGRQPIGLTSPLDAFRGDERVLCNPPSFELFA